MNCRGNKTVNQSGHKRILLIASRTSPVPFALFPPAGIFYIAAFLEKAGFQVKMIDCNKANDPEEEIISSLPDFSLVGITANVATMRNAADIAKLIREHSPNTTIVIGGPHPTNIYENLIPRFADIVVMGEGEYAMKRIAQGDDLAEIENIAYWNNGLKMNKRVSFIENLDELPFPAWHLIDIRKYALKTLFRRIPKAIMLTSRGCPNHCAYCTKTVHGYKIRLRSVKNVMDEIGYLIREFGIRQIEFWDDNFTFYPQRAKDICLEIISNGFHEKVQFLLPNGIRADIYDEEMFNLMGKANFKYVVLGIESGSQRVQEKMGHNLDLGVVEKTIRGLRSAGIKVCLYFILGLPFESISEMRASIDLAKRLPANSAIFFIAIPFPGTAMYDTVKKNGNFLTDMMLEGRDYFGGKAVFETNELKSSIAEKMYRKAYKEYYLRPSKILHGLEIWLSGYGPRRLKNFLFNG